LTIIISALIILANPRPVEAEMLIAEASAVAAATAEDVWARWADVATWQEWDDGIEWCRLDGAFQAGSKGQLRPKGGPTVRFVLMEAAQGVGFRDRSFLPLARLDFTHRVEPVDGGVRITHRVEIGGPLGWLFGRVMGAGFREGLPQTVRSLAAAAERREVAA
jgi:Polyketide cyclase / dehydrase and lipid transport